MSSIGQKGFKKATSLENVDIGVYRQKAAWPDRSFFQMVSKIPQI